MRLKKSEYLPASALRILLVILQAQEKGELLSLRGITRKLGLTGTQGNWTKTMLERLRAAGLITFLDFKHGTIRATCTMTIYPEAFR